MTYLKYATAAAVIGLAGAFATPAVAAQNKDDCIAQFGTENPNSDMMDLKSDAGKKYTEVATKVDVNNDGMISRDEYVVACTKDLLKKGKE